MASGEVLVDAGDLARQRAELMGENVALNYSKSPLCIMRGRGQYLYDETGREFTDCVNNVCHVGHCEPSVVAAASRQLETLNTNSRYLHPEILRYSRRLTATMPAPLAVVYWVNSGSEATDLALRLARAHTGKRGVLTVGGAYHGHLTSIIDISPYKYKRHGGAGRRPHVREAPIPDVFAGRYRGSIADSTLGAAYAADVAGLVAEMAGAEAREARRRDALQALARLHLVTPTLSESGGGCSLLDAGGDGHARSVASPTASKPQVQTAPAGNSPTGSGASSTTCASGVSGGAGAVLDGPGGAALADLLASLDEYALDDDGLSAGCGAFICESVLSCGGQVVPPPGYFAGVYEAVRAGGGVCIADEVQVGFGRVGSAFWGFQLQGVVPDIVTMGKPMGNGFPCAAVVTTRAIADSFAATQMEYFNTFGGNPVAGAVANAVLDSIQARGLQAHAADVGGVLLAGFGALCERFPFVGSSRGVGLMVGLEIVHPLTPQQKVDPLCALRVPWTAAASDLVYAMKDRGFLLSTDGMDSNVIKLKPPMTFSIHDAERVVAALGEAMGALADALASRGVVVGATSGDGPGVLLAALAAEYYRTTPELAPRPVPR